MQRKCLCQMIKGRGAGNALWVVLWSEKLKECISCFKTIYSFQNPVWSQTDNLMAIQHLTVMCSQCTIGQSWNFWWCFSHQNLLLSFCHAAAVVMDLDKWCAINFKTWHRDSLYAQTPLSSFEQQSFSQDLAKAAGGSSSALLCKAKARRSGGTETFHRIWACNIATLCFGTVCSMQE